MKVKLPARPGYVFDARFVSGASVGHLTPVLEVNVGTSLLLAPPHADGCEVADATEAEWAELRAAGYELQKSARLADNVAARMVLPIGRSGWAIAAGYAGLFALVVVPAPLALLLGVVAVWHLKKHPQKFGWGRAIFGLVTGIVWTVLLIVLAIKAL